MTLELKNRVRSTSTTTGTGAYTIAASPPAGFQSFDAITTTREVYYCAVMDSDWEVGIGTVTVGGSITLSRDTILDSSNSGAAVNWGAGTKDIFVTSIAEVLNRFYYDGTDVYPTSDLSSEQTPSALSSGENDDWNVTLSGNTVVNAEGVSGSELTGLLNGASRRRVTIVNVGSNSIIFRSQSTSSTAANRFAMNGDQIVPAGAAISFIYNATISRWSHIG